MGTLGQTQTGQHTAERGKPRVPKRLLEVLGVRLEQPNVHRAVSFGQRSERRRRVRRRGIQLRHQHERGERRRNS
eukprot:685383-Rhodomonas_salina.1